MSALALGKSKTTHGVELQAVCTGGTLSDLISQIGTTDISYIYSSWAGMNYWDSLELRSTMMDHSGMYHIQNATAPTIMFHGIDDPRMPLSQSFQLHYALKQRGELQRLNHLRDLVFLPAVLVLVKMWLTMLPAKQTQQTNSGVCVLLCAGIPVRFVTFPGSGHIPSDPVQIKTVWDESLDWMDTHMPITSP